MMQGLRVLKFGGTSMGSHESIRKVAEKVQLHRQSAPVVVVVSAMVGETDRLLQLANAQVGSPSARESDQILATGEMVAAALLASTLTHMGLPAKSLVGEHTGLRTDNTYGRANIRAVEPVAILSVLEADEIPVVAGFQGVDEAGNLTTLGRGGSDSTAIVIAHTLKAESCLIYTDVDGIYTADPRLVKDAKHIDCLDTEEMLELSSSGAKVMQTRAMVLSHKFETPLRVLSTFSSGEGTLICPQKDTTMLESPSVRAVASKFGESAFVLSSLPSEGSVLEKVFQVLAKEGVVVDVITYHVDLASGKAFLGFSTDRSAFDNIQSVLHRDFVKPYGASLHTLRDAAKVAIAGTGMRIHIGVAQTAFTALHHANIHIELVSTSEIKIIFVVKEADAEIATQRLHEAFHLGG